MLTGQEGCRKYYRIADGAGTPLAYADFQTPLARGAVRLGVFRLTDAISENLVASANKATLDVLAALPEGAIFREL